MARNHQRLTIKKPKNQEENSSAWAQKKTKTLKKERLLLYKLKHKNFRMRLFSNFNNKRDFKSGYPNNLKNKMRSNKVHLLSQTL